MFGNNFLELLAVTDAAAVPPAAPDRFSFAAHNRDFLATAEGMSLLALHSADAHADAARFRANHIGDYAALDFGRNTVLPGEARRASSFHLARDRSRHARDRLLHLPAASPAGTVLEAGIPAPPQRRVARDRGRDVGAPGRRSTAFPRAHHGKLRPSLRPAMETKDNLAKVGVIRIAIRRHHRDGAGGWPGVAGDYCDSDSARLPRRSPIWMFEQCGY